MTDLWQCLDCLRTGPLDIHGRCACGSSAVYPEARLTNEVAIRSELRYKRSGAVAE